MIFVRKIDGNGMFVEDALVSELTEFTVETPCPSGFHKPKWDGAQWIEGMSQSEIDALKNVAHTPTTGEKLAALQAENDTLKDQLNEATISGAATSQNLSDFMDFYFTSNPE